MKHILGSEYLAKGGKQFMRFICLPITEFRVLN
jgi:hypothetical protein